MTCICNTDLIPMCEGCKAVKKINCTCDKDGKSCDWCVYQDALDARAPEDKDYPGLPSFSDTVNSSSVVIGVIPFNIGDRVSALEEQLDALKTDGYSPIRIDATPQAYDIITLNDFTGSIKARINYKFEVDYPNGEDKMQEAFKIFWAGLAFHGKTMDMQIKQLESKLAIATKGLENVLESFDKDDYTCERCHWDQNVVHSNAAYSAREALQKIREIG